MKFRHRYYKQNGIMLHYVDIGRGRPLIFLHGVLADALTYRKWLLLFAKKYRVIAPDLPCFGTSGAPNKPWDFNDYADLFNALAASLALKDIIVIGHSFGGGIALCMAAKNKKISRLILLGSAGAPADYSKLKFAFRLCIEQNMRALIASGRIDVLAKAGLRIAKSTILHLPKLGVVLKTIRKSLKKDYSKELEKVRAKTLIIRGRTDKVFPKASAQFLKKRIRKSKLMLVEGGHSWLLFQPEKFEGIVSKWIGS